MPREATKTQASKPQRDLATAVTFGVDYGLWRWLFRNFNTPELTKLLENTALKIVPPIAALNSLIGLARKINKKGAVNLDRWDAYDIIAAGIQTYLSFNLWTVGYELTGKFVTLSEGPLLNFIKAIASASSTVASEMIVKCFFESLERSCIKKQEEVSDSSYETLAGDEQETPEHEPTSYQQHLVNSLRDGGIYFTFSWVKDALARVIQTERTLGILADATGFGLGVAFLTYSLDGLIDLLRGAQEEMPVPIPSQEPRSSPETELEESVESPGSDKPQSQVQSFSDDPEPEHEHNPEQSISDNTSYFFGSTSPRIPQGEDNVTKETQQMQLTYA